MSSNEVVIQARDLSKCYHIYDKPMDRLKQFFLPAMTRVLRRDSQNYYREFWALRNVSFEVKRGQAVGIIGTNGSGKSTLLQIICGTLSQSSGEIETRGRIAALLELGSGFNPEFTGRENVLMSCALLGMHEDVAKERFADIVEFSGIGDFVEQPVKTYSSGMFVRLAFAAIIHSDPRILVVDEALAVGDESFQRKCIRRIRELREDGLTLLFVSHSPSDVVSLCDQAILLDKGVAVEEGDPAQVLRRYHARIFNSKEPDQPVAPKRPALTSGEILPEDQSADLEDYFDSTLAEPPALSYEKNGGEIYDVAVLNERGLETNTFPSGYDAILRYRFKCDSTQRGVRFGFHIKTIQGLELAGLSIPSSFTEIPVLEAGVYEVRFPVCFRLAPGSYFVTVGARSIESDSFLHRMADCLQVKVLRNEFQRFFGLCDISAEGTPQVTEVEN